MLRMTSTYKRFDSNGERLPDEVITEVTSYKELPELKQSRPHLYRPTPIGKLLQSDVTEYHSKALQSCDEWQKDVVTFGHVHSRDGYSIARDEYRAHIMSNSTDSECECHNPNYVHKQTMHFVTDEYKCTVTVSAQALLNACNQVKAFGNQLAVSLNGSFRYAATSIGTGGMVGEVCDGDELEVAKVGRNIRITNVSYSHTGANVTFSINAKYLADAVSFLTALPAGTKKQAPTKHRIGTVAPLITVQTNGGNDVIVLSAKWDEEEAPRYALLIPVMTKNTPTVTNASVSQDESE